MRDEILLGSCVMLLTLACSSRSTTEVVVEPNDGGATTSFGGSPSGGKPAAGGISSRTTTQSLGGKSAFGGTSARNISSLMGGTSAAGGTTLNGGSTARGGAGTQGGATTLGGSAALGGTSAFGGASSRGGTSALGGSSSLGGTSTLGGSSSLGGTSALGGSSATTSVVELQPGPTAAADTQIVFAEGPAAGSHGNENYGKMAAWSVGCFDHNTVIRGLIRFELPSAIKPGKVVSAQLVLTPVTWIPKDPVGPLEIFVHKLLKSWKQGMATADSVVNSSDVDGATGLESSFGVPWSTVGVGTNGQDATASYASFVAKTYDKNSPDLSVWTFDVTPYVSDWATSPSSNYGFLLKSSEYFAGLAQDSYSFPQFHSGEASDATKRPKLVVTYKP